MGNDRVGTGSLDLQILECTLRDGSYAVDFQFTERDTAALAQLLSGIGFKWIEVGHGLGLYASEAGKGQMPASDEEIIKAAKSFCADALIGMFCISGVATLTSLKSARQAGLDFVRIGSNVDEIEKALPYIEEARKVGLIPFLNAMKTYAVSPKEFAKNAKIAVRAGAEVIYCVDSSGCMCPDDIRHYFDALKQTCECKMGLHAHNNLQLAMANAIEAYRSGARFIDTTLYGIGRSAGNIPTEVAIAVFEKLGVQTGINLFEVIDIAEKYMKPLMSKIQLYDMLGVVMGYSGFHSSFLPAVEKVADKYGVDLRRLVSAVGRFDPLRVNEQVIEKIAASLPKPGKRQLSEHSLVLFPDKNMDSHRISSSLQAVDRLIKGMVITSAKQRSVPVLELMPAVSQSEDLVTADLIMSNDEVVLGRITYGSYSVLEEVLKRVKNNIGMFLVNYDGDDWSGQAYEKIVSEVGNERALPISSQKLLEEYLGGLLHSIRYNCGKPMTLFIYGDCNPRLLNYASDIFKQILLYGKNYEKHCLPANCKVISGITELKVADNIGAVLCLLPPNVADAQSIGSMLLKNGFFITLGEVHRLYGLVELNEKRVITIDPSKAYQGIMRRCMAIKEMMRPRRSIMERDNYENG